ncbi:uncharacterized protein BBOV_IV004090 [Babesia bovis T2Bo]|uniref:UDP-N-acetylglucosamine transferase subunit ALG14 n=1 Tax=Babesia bovis TaxID=5865 RepID=A7AQF1_BABBO|nr:uncharacterized protein BBOV_IV004090 [Babesia bovis T2Bo]EDO06770.1 Oligosaccharide biosynthesis protein Alg14 like family protein [Babesia bovis T2Bo]|eukprot:XP_001610338.1 conserved membrane protein [Babesia bovis T2Bo]
MIKALLYLGTIIAALISIVWIRKRGNKSNTNSKWKVAVVIGPGGHAREMRDIMKSLPNRCSTLVYIVGNDKDVATERLIHQLSQSVETDVSINQQIYSLPVPKSHRESYTQAAIKGISSFIKSLNMLYTEQPDLIITNGPGIAVPICFAATVLNLIFRRNIKLIYIESMCRVEDLSFTGKLLYPVVHTLVVMWPHLSQKWPGVTYLGTIKTL